MSPPLTDGNLNLHPTLGSRLSQPEFGMTHNRGATLIAAENLTVLCGGGEREGRGSRDVFVLASVCHEDGGETSAPVTSLLIYLRSVCKAIFRPLTFIALVA